MAISFNLNSMKIVQEVAAIGERYGDIDEDLRRHTYKACIVNGTVTTERRTGWGGAWTALFDNENHSSKVYEVLRAGFAAITNAHDRAVYFEKRSPLRELTLEDAINIRKATKLFLDSHKETSKAPSTHLKVFAASTERFCRLVEAEFNALDDKEEALEENGAESSGLFPNAQWGTPQTVSKLPSTPLEALLGIFPTKETLGEGGFGSVSKWEDHSGNQFAVKLFKEAAHPLEGKEFQQYTSLEKGEITALLVNDHPYIVKTHALLLFNSKTKQYMVINRASQIPREDRKYYQIKAVVSEVVEGEELFYAMRTRGADGKRKKATVKFSARTARKIGRDVSAALVHIHLRGLVYRDLKPKNILIDHEGNIKIIDFGLGKEIPKGKKTRTFCGTPAYVAPELLVKHRNYSNKIDSWTLGVLLIKLVTRWTPAFFEKKGANKTDSRSIMYRNIKRFARLNDDEKKAYLKRHTSFRDCDDEDLLNTIVALMKNDPEERISCKDAHLQLLSGGAREVG